MQLPHQVFDDEAGTTPPRKQQFAPPLPHNLWFSTVSSKEARMKDDMQRFHLKPSTLLKRFLHLNSSTHPISTTTFIETLHLFFARWHCSILAHLSLYCSPFSNCKPFFGYIAGVRIHSAITHFSHSLTLRYAIRIPFSNTTAPSSCKLSLSTKTDC